ncbi:hypothetical protein [Tabrizicola sp.]|uniref:hypothetical protein n=1 Tax=Tabrizicola sp. TaxID=2005166 RepID=UPI002615ABD9|nr:hypothetical protein [Tabrizicola sp.]MDM7933697.1 hypothetical protein [Tabrizicola sp.]
MTSFVHLIEGDSAEARRARIADLARSSRNPPLILTETGDVPCTPLDWLMGPGCTCCLPDSHPRQRLLRAASQPLAMRILIDAGPPAVADRIIAILRAMPVRLHLNLVAAQDVKGAAMDTNPLTPSRCAQAFNPRLCQSAEVLSGTLPAEMARKLRRAHSTA